MKNLFLSLIAAVVLLAIGCKKDEDPAPVASFTLSVDTVDAYSSSIISLRNSSRGDEVTLTNTSQNADSYILSSSLLDESVVVTDKDPRTWEYEDVYGCAYIKDTITLTAIKGSKTSTATKILIIDPLCFEVARR